MIFVKKENGTSRLWRVPFFKLKFKKYLDSSEKHFSRKNDRSSSKTDRVGLGEEKCLRDPRGSRMGKEKGFRMVLEQAAVGLGNKKCLRDPSRHGNKRK